MSGRGVVMRFATENASITNTDQNLIPSFLLVGYGEYAAQQFWQPDN